MSLKRNSLKIIGLCAAVLLSVQLIMPMFSAGAKGPQTTSTIGGIEITEKKSSDIEGVLVNAVVEWKSQPLIVRSATSSMEIPTEYILFNIQETVDNFLQESKAPFYMPWKKRKVVHLPLVVEGTEELNSILMENAFIYVDETKDAVLEHARYLKTDDVQAEEREITKDFMDRVAFEIQQAPYSSTSLSPLVSMLDGFVLSSDETFSFLDKTAEITGTVDIESRRFFASVLYSVVLQAETSILERHSQNKIPAYLQPGIEVDVSNRLHKDFAFKNNSHSPMLFHARMDGENLIIELYMPGNAKEITYSVVKDEVKPKTIYRLSPTLNSNQQRITEEGRSGYRVTVHRSTSDELVSQDFYPPVHRVVEVSSREEVKAESDNTDGSAEGSDENSTTDTHGTNHKENSQNENKSTTEQKGNDASKSSGGASSNELKEGSSSNDQEDVIYDKGGDVIYDPNA